MLQLISFQTHVQALKFSLVTVVGITCVLGGSLNLNSEKYFLTIGFSFVIISIVISLVGFINSFAVCITIKTIPTFPTWNYSSSFL